MLSLTRFMGCLPLLVTSVVAAEARSKSRAVCTRSESRSDFSCKMSQRSQSRQHIKGQKEAAGENTTVGRNGSGNMQGLLVIVYLVPCIPRTHDVKHRHGLPHTEHARARTAVVVIHLEPIVEIALELIILLALQPVLKRLMQHMTYLLQAVDLLLPDDSVVHRPHIDPGCQKRQQQLHQSCY